MEVRGCESKAFQWWEFITDYNLIVFDLLSEIIGYNWETACSLYKASGKMQHFNVQRSSFTLSPEKDIFISWW